MTPLNSMTYIDLITSHGDDDNSSQPQGHVELSQFQGDVELLEPAKEVVVYFPPLPSEEVQNKMTSVTQNKVCVTGTAAPGAIEPVPGSMDICESEDTWEDDEQSQPEGDLMLLEPASKPIVLYFPSQPSEELHDQIMSTTPNPVCLTGSAVFGAIQQDLGKMDVRESKNTYLFQLARPGVARDEFTCDVAPNGMVLIKGVATTGLDIICKHSKKSEMSQILYPPLGPFSLSFKLPGPVDQQDFTGHIGVDVIFKGIVKKKNPSA